MTMSNIYGRDHFEDFDLDSPEFNEHFDAVIPELHARCPVPRSNVGHGYWVITGYEDNREVAQNWQTFSSAKGFQPNRPDDMPYIYPEESDPPYHNRWRTSLNQYFAPRAVRAYRPKILALVHSLTDGFISRGECDFVSEFANPLAGGVFLTCFMGTPLEDLRTIQDGVDRALFGPLEGRKDAWIGVLTYIDEYLTIRASQPPRGDYIDAVLQGVDLDDGTPCPWDHKVSVLTDLLAGGIGTTAYVLSGMAHHLAQHPEDRTRLLEDPAIHQNAIEELTRYWSPLVALGRSATRDAEVHGQKIREGDFLVVSYAAACRDPKIFENPEKIDFDRKLPSNAAFGFGPHRCIGSHLARQVIDVVFKEFLPRMPAWTIAPDAKITFQTGLTRYMNELPITFEPKPDPNTSTK